MPDDPPRRPGRGPAPQLGTGPAGPQRDRQRRADVPERLSSSTQPGETIPAVDASRAGTRTGLPASASGPGREEAAAGGLYAWGDPRHGHGPGVQQPAAPAGEADSFDLPPLPWMLTRRPPEPAAEAEAGE